LIGTGEPRRKEPAKVSFTRTAHVENSAQISCSPLLVSFHQCGYEPHLAQVREVPEVDLSIAARGSIKCGAGILREPARRSAAVGALLRVRHRRRADGYAGERNANSAKLSEACVLTRRLPRASARISARSQDFSLAPVSRPTSTCSPLPSGAVSGGWPCKLASA